jgi:hypothetical protein
MKLDPVGLSHYPISADQLPDLPTSGVRVVFFGDSRAQEWNFPSGAEGFEFYNRGIGGQTSVQVVARFEEHVATVEPDIVVVQVGVNDLAMIPLVPERREELVANCKANEVGYEALNERLVGVLRDVAQ